MAPGSCKAVRVEMHEKRDRSDENESIPCSLEPSENPRRIFVSLGVDCTVLLLLLLGVDCTAADQADQGKRD